MSPVRKFCGENKAERKEKMLEEMKRMCIRFKGTG